MKKHIKNPVNAVLQWGLVASSLMGTLFAATPYNIGSEYLSHPRELTIPGSFAYDYAPSMMRDGNTGRSYWLGTNPQWQLGNWNQSYGGDCIMYATGDAINRLPGASGAASITWNISNTPVLIPRGIAGTFDEGLVGDPTVLRNEAQTAYYLFYGGAPHDGNHNQVGSAQSSGPTGFVRRDNGNPLIQYRSPKAWGTCYGTGQPSATKGGDGKYYMIFTNVRRISSGGGLAGATHAIRADDVSFTNNVDEYNGSGWTRILTGGKPAGAVLPVAFTAPLYGGSHVMDIAYHTVVQRFIITDRASNDSYRLRFRTGSFGNMTDTATIAVTNSIRDSQPALWRNQEGHITHHTASNPSGRTSRFTLFYQKCLPGRDPANIFYYDIHAKDFHLDIP
ncbi:MAG: hypothetical protein V4819_01905 [Verrucomicrobiota bacterium]